MPLNFNSVVALGLGAWVSILALAYSFILVSLTAVLPPGFKYRIRGYGVRLLEMGLHALFRRSFDVHMSGSIIDPQENALVFLNHQGIIDYLLIFHLATRVELFFFIHGYCVRFPTARVILRAWRYKSNWMVPQRSLDHVFSEYNRTPGPKWVVMFPEVKWWTPALLRESQLYCKLAGTTPLKSLLYPRFPGVIQGIEYLRSSATSIYDLRVNYEPNVPTINVLISPDKWTAKVSVQQVRISHVPRSPKRLERFVEKLWYRKDKEFSKSGEGKR